MTTKKKVIGTGLFVLGVLLIIFAVYPIADYIALSRKKFPPLISPLIEGQEIVEKKDLTNAKNWFENNVNFSGATEGSYQLAIPKLKISEALVQIGTDDLSKSLIQYPGTALPGEVGNAVVFGHSVLPIFFNPENYMTIFSTLAKLDQGDEVIVVHDGYEYTYIVESMFEVTPKDIQILEQNKIDSYITLVTCSPPGHPKKPKRLIVRAKLASYNQVNEDTSN